MITREPSLALASRGTAWVGQRSRPGWELMAAPPQPGAGTQRTDSCAVARLGPPAASTKGACRRGTGRAASLGTLVGHALSQPAGASPGPGSGGAEALRCAGALFPCFVPCKPLVTRPGLKLVFQEPPVRPQSSLSPVGCKTRDHSGAAPETPGSLLPPQCPFHPTGTSPGTGGWAAASGYGCTGVCTDEHRNQSVWLPKALRACLSSLPAEPLAFSFYLWL